MKISKSKQELARIISENDGWIAGGFAAQQDDGEIWFSATKPIWTNRCGTFDMGYEGHFTIGHLIANRHQTILSRAEYLHLYPAPNADGWIEWKGGECPVGRGTLVDVKYADNTINCGVSALTNSAHEDHVFGTFGSMTADNWGAGLPMSGIIAYRLHKPEQAEANPAERDEQVWTNPPTIEQLAADYRNAKDYADRKQEEADAAKADAEAKLADLIAAGKALGLVLSVEREGGAITPIHPPLIAGDWLSWRQWEVGDFVSWSILGHIGDFKIIAVHHDASRSIGDFEIEDSFGGVYRAYGNECKFIRRP